MTYAHVDEWRRIFRMDPAVLVIVARKVLFTDTVRDFPTWARCKACEVN